MLHAANLGDSGFMVLRGKRVVFRSRTQQHQFNFPYQARVHIYLALPWRASSNLGLLQDTCCTTKWLLWLV